MQPRSLYRRIYWHFLLLLVGVSALSSWIFLGSWPGTYLTDNTTRTTQHVARLLTAAPSPAARRSLAGALGDELDLDLTLRDSHGTVIAQRGHLLPAIDLEPRLPEPQLHRELGLWFYSISVRASDEPTLVLECVPASFNNWGIPVRKALSMVGLLFLIGIAVRPLARRISRPVELLIRASRRFGDGDLSTRVMLPMFGHHHHHHHHMSRWHARHLKRLAKGRGGDELFTLMHAWNDMAERIERQVTAQRELLANVSHELRSPLARIRVALVLLPTGDEKSQKRIADIEADLAELDALIEQVLQTSRLEATGTPAHEDRFSVSALFEEVLSRAAADPLTAPLQASLELHREPQGVYVNGDQALLRRALFNLVENAAKYGAAPVTLGFVAETNSVAFVVTDHGPGIAVEDRACVVQPFVRGDTAHTPGRGGVGLGLSFATRVAEVHGGSISLESAPGHGLRVLLHLPSSRIA